MKISIPLLFMGLVAFFMGYIFFSQIFTEHHEDFHSDAFETIALGVFGFLFMLLGIGLLVFGLFGSVYGNRSKKQESLYKNTEPDVSKKSPLDKGKAKRSWFSYSFWILLIYIMVFSGNWDFNRLNGYFNNLVYVELLENRSLNDLQTALNIEPKFYQFKPTIFGNHIPYQIQIKNNQYSLKIQPLDDVSEKSVLIEDGNITVNEISFDYPKQLLFHQSVTASVNSHYRFRAMRGSSDILKLSVDSKTDFQNWTMLSKYEVPAKVIQQAEILEAYFPSDRSGGLTQLNSKYYLNYSHTFHNRTASIQFNSNYHTIESTSGVKTTRWKPMAPLYNNVVHAHQGNIFSFGGFQHKLSGGAGNWMYSPKTDQWKPLSATPKSASNKSRFSTNIASVFSANNNLYVLTNEKKISLFEFETNSLNAKGNWHLIKKFPMLSDLKNWRYLDDNTLYAYDTSYPWVDGHKLVKGYIQTLNLSSFKTQTLAMFPNIDHVSKSNSILNVKSYAVRVINHNKKLYLVYAGQFFKLKRNN